MLGLAPARCIDDSQSQFCLLGSLLSVRSLRACHHPWQAVKLLRRAKYSNTPTRLKVESDHLNIREMKLKPLLALSTLLLAIGCRARADESASKAVVLGSSKVVKSIWKTDGGELEVFDNSATYSQILDINASGAVVGMREVLDEKKTITSQVYFYLDDKISHDIPKLDGYTNIEVKALSDDGKVVGYASRRIGSPNGSLTAILWDRETKKVVNLGALEGDTTSQAQDISADGSLIVGYSTGARPARIRPCVWKWKPSAQQWEAAELDTKFFNNPYLVTGGVAISPDGQRIAACITVEILSNQFFDSSLFIWEVKDGSWTRRLVSDDAGRIKDMNNRGDVVMNITSPEGPHPFWFNSDGIKTAIELLPGDVTGQAQAIDENRVVVGLSDDPAGPVGGPEAFVWQEGKTSSPSYAQNAFYSASYASNAKGQVGGLIDVVIVDGNIKLAGPKGQRIGEDIGDVKEEDIEAKTIGFRWTPRR